MDALDCTEAQIRAKVSRLGLRARGISEAWHKNNKEHSIRMTGRKRPDQSIVMKQLHAQGKLTKTAEQNMAASLRVKAHIAQNGHNRGALGMKHTDATKLLIGEKSREMYKNLSDEKKMEKVRKMMATRTKNGTVAPPRLGATWKAAWREIGGVKKFYRSRWEANYARYLEFIKKAGLIQHWEHEPETFWFEGIKRGCVSYLPDFRVTENSGRVVYHEVKGWMDDRSKTKIKRMAKYYPAVVLVVIDSTAYKALEKKIASMVPGWE